MSRVCQITGKKTRAGRTYSRRGLEKRKGGVGKKITGVTQRQFKVNLQWKKVWVPELGKSIRIRVSTKALKTIAKNGAYSTLLKAGMIKPVRGKKKAQPAAAAETA